MRVTSATGILNKLYTFFSRTLLLVKSHRLGPGCVPTLLVVLGVACMHVSVSHSKMRLLHVHTYVHSLDVWLDEYTNSFCVRVCDRLPPPSGSSSLRSGEGQGRRGGVDNQPRQQNCAHLPLCR